MHKKAIYLDMMIEERFGVEKVSTVLTLASPMLLSQVSQQLLASLEYFLVQNYLILEEEKKLHDRENPLTGA